MRGASASGPGAPFGSPGLRLLLALAAGGLYATSLPPVGLWPLGWIALAPLCIACAGVSPGWAAGLGLVGGMVAAIGTSPWLPAMLADYFRIGAAGVWPLALLSWLLVGALYFGLFGAWIGWATTRGRLSPLVVGAVWWLLEWGRANAPIANPWALLGYSQMGWRPAAQTADLFGPYGVSALLAASSAALAGGLVPALRGRSAVRSAVAVAALVALSVAYGLARLAPDRSRGATLRVGVVQGAIERSHRYERAHLVSSLETHLELTRRLAAQGAELVVWPELALDFYVEREPALRRRVTRAAKALDVHVVAGGLGSLGERPTNSVFSIDANGVQDRYDKVRLMVFSESRPLPLFPIGSDRLAAGSGPRTLDHEGVALGIATCSEAMQADYVRAVVRTGAELLVAPSMDGWFGSVGAMRQQLDAVAMRAIESRRFVLRPTVSGVTAVVDPGGRIVAEAPLGQAAGLVADVAPRTDLTLYARIGDAGVGVAALAVLLDAWRRRGRRVVQGPSRATRGTSA